MTTPGWRFRPHTQEERASDDFAEELFRTSRNTDLAESLVRETIQNSLDAGANSGEQVRVRFVGGLGPRLDSPELKTIEPPSPGGDVRVLTVEDFGTVGLEGDPKRYDDPAGDAKDRYWEFWRNLGRGNRGQARRGRWGLGKSVFHISSRIGTYFGLTVRRSDDRSLLMGMSQLKVHYIGTQRYDSYGYFGLQDGNNFTNPIEDIDQQGSFSAAFNVTRSGQPGLSLAVPFCSDEIDAASIVEAVVRGYFFPLLTGELVVDVEEEGRSTRIDRDYVETQDSIEGLNDGVIEMARYAISSPKAIDGLMADPPRTASAIWDELDFDQEKLDELSSALASDSMAEVTVPVFVHPSDTSSILSNFRVILREEPDRSSRPAMFIRNGITITEVKHNSPRGFSALVITDDDAISKFLGDSENPAHTAWKSNRPKFGPRYKHWNPTIRFVSEAPFSITEQLSGRETVLDPNLFSDLFFVDLGDVEAKRKKKPAKKKTDTDTTDPPELPDLKGTRFVTSKTDGGFRVIPGELCPSVPFRMRIKMAYASKTSRSSTKSWDRFDFDLKDRSITVDAGSTEIVERVDNSLVLDITDTDFDVRVTGFDENRDLFVAPPRVLEVE